MMDRAARSHRMASGWIFNDTDTTMGDSSVKCLFRVISLIFFTMGLAGFGAAHAQSYPSKPVRMIVPFAAGGPTDLFARVIAQKLSELWGQQVIIDNRPGASAIIGAEVASKAAPDGYTILMATSTSHAANVSLFSKLPYDPVKDFAPISLMGSTPFILVVHPSVPAHSVKELVALAKSRPGQLNFAGGSSSAQAGGELFKMLANVNMVHVPYKSNAPGLADLLGGQVQLMFDGLNTALPHVKSGKLRALAVTSATRTTAAPELPTMVEGGVPGYELTAWLALFAPAGTPKEIVTKIAADASKVVKMPEVVEKFRSQAFDPVGSTPEQLAAYQKTEIVKWAKIVKDANMKVD